MVDTYYELQDLDFNVLELTVFRKPSEARGKLGGSLGISKRAVNTTRFGLRCAVSIIYCCYCVFILVARFVVNVFNF